MGSFVRETEEKEGKIGARQHAFEEGAGQDVLFCAFGGGDGKFVGETAILRQRPAAFRRPFQAVGKGQGSDERSPFEAVSADAFGEDAFPVLRIGGEHAFPFQKDQPAFRPYGAAGKFFRQGQDEEAARRFEGELQRPLAEDGDERGAQALLRDDFQGKVGGREIAGVHGDPVAENVHFAAIWRGETQPFREEKAHGQGAFGYEADECVILGADVREAFEQVRPARKFAVEKEGAGAGGEKVDFHTSIYSFPGAGMYKGRKIC